MQIHPTTLYSSKPGRRFLISESVRGEGAVLLDKDGERFCNELMPRDVVTGDIRAQMQKDGTDHVWLDMRPVGERTLREHFPTIFARCREEGYDPLKVPVPVVPAQHYFMGGVKVDLGGRTSMPRLFAAGETACNGVHGKNRLASNSLLESLIWAERRRMRWRTATSVKNFPPYPSPPTQTRRRCGRRTQKTSAKRRNGRLPLIDDISMKIRADELIRMALAEDVTSEDVSTSSVLPAPAEGEADLLCKQSGVVAGLPVFARVFELLGGVRVTLLAKDGDRVEKGQKLAVLRGDMRAILTGERTALNFLQRHERHRHLHGQDGRPARGQRAQTRRHPQDHPQYAPV